ncbi:MAG: hypothetical protein ABI165_01625 [Bryobacteraceae bacterium]
MSLVSSRKHAANAKVSWPQYYLGVAFTTMGTLTLELALTRIFSVVFYYHFAFLAISIAMFGLGAGGVFSYVVAARPGALYSKLGMLAWLNALVVVAALTFVISRAGELGNLTLAMVYFASALPFFLAGALVSLAVSEAIDRVDRVYFSDLLGAAAGCLALVPLLRLVGGPNTVIAAAILYAVSAAMWFNLAGANRRRASAVVLALALLVLIVFNAKAHVIDLKYAKGHPLQNEIFVKWNSFSRIALTPEQGNTGRMSIIIDADAATTIANYDWDHMTAEERSGLLLDGPGYPYVLRPAAKTLIIGPGGGFDVARAFASGSKDITGVEINPIIATTIMRQKYPQLSQRLYFRPEVHIVVEDGRSFVRRTHEKFQVLQATLVDTWASTAAGAFALSENNLYTTDAFYDYLTHLTGDGLMAFTRWGFEPPRESLRLVTIAMDALGRLGERETWRHVIVIRANAQNLGGWGAQDTILISRKPFTPGDVTRIRQAAAKQLIYAPGDKPVNEFGQLLLSPDPERYENSYQYNVTPVGDDRPFFFYTVQARDLWQYLSHANSASEDYKINKAVPMLFELLIISLLATGLILALPRVMLGSQLPREKGVLAFLWYFLFIGAGYILIQVALIQKFVLFLGHPTYALTVIIFSMLIASGLGSYWSRSVVAGSQRRLRTVLAGVTALVIVLAFTVSPLAESGVGLPLWLKIGITVLVIAPVAFLMGMPFPSGLSRLEVRHHASIRWAWALNAAASVLGSGVAIVLAIYLGLRLTLTIGGSLYLCALATLELTRLGNNADGGEPAAR